MNPTYIQTFSRHKLLFSLPIVLTTILAVWFALGTPKQYKATASLWVDTPPPGVSSLNDTNPAVVTPAAQTQQLLGELLTTKQFRLTVGRRSPLTSYLAAHPTPGWGPTALLKKLRGSGSAADRTAAALDMNHVLVTIDGPQVVGIQLQGPAPVVAVGTLRTLVDTFNHERRNLDVARQQGAMEHFKNQQDAASATVNSLKTQIANYSNTPGASYAELQGLVQAQRAAEKRLTNATRGYNQAALGLGAAKVEKDSFRVIDKPKLPAPAVSGMKKSVMVVFAGLFVGALISFLAIVLLTGDGRRTEQTELREAVLRPERESRPVDEADRPPTAKAESGRR